MDYDNLKSDNLEYDILDYDTLNCDNLDYDNLDCTSVKVHEQSCGCEEGHILKYEPPYRRHEQTLHKERAQKYI